jgi:hypothetical protein
MGVHGPWIYQRWDQVPWRSKHPLPTGRSRRAPHIKRNKSTAYGTKYARHIFWEAMILNFWLMTLKKNMVFFSHHEESLC